MRLLAGFAVVVAILLAGAAALEIALRLGPGRRALPPPVASPDLPVLTPQDLVRPSVRGTFRGVLYESNRFGFRGPDVESQKPAGTVRIVVIGDSVTMGSGVLGEATYSARLEAALNSGSTGPRYEVLNLGWGGASFEVSLARLFSVGLPLDPDVVVYGFSLDDLDGRHYRRTWTGRDRDARPETPPRSHVWRWLRPRVRSLLELVAPPSGSFLGELDANYFENPEAWQVFLDNLDALVWAGRRHGFCTHVLIHATLHHLHRFHPYRRHYEAVTAAARERGLPVTSTLETFLANSHRPLHVSPADAHPNDLGHRLIARALMEGLVASPAECGIAAASGSMLSP